MNCATTVGNVTNAVAGWFVDAAGGDLHLKDGTVDAVIDLFGPGFTLLRLGPDAPDAEALIAAARDRDVPLHVHHVTELDVVDLYDRRLVLVRPDGHVAWRGDEAPRDAMEIALHVTGQK